MKFCAAMLAVAAAHAATIAAQSPKCSLCHQRQSLHQASTSMARALETVAGCDILRSHPKLAFESGEFRYSIARDGDRSIYTVTGGTQTLTVPIAWAFGLGTAGQTYVFQRDGKWYESRVSFYKGIDGLDITMGAQGKKPAGLMEAAGREMAPVDARDCFDCHATNAVHDGKLTVETLHPGVACERCHTTALEHARAIQAGDAKHAQMPKLAKLSTEEMSDFCGQCHRTWSFIAMNGPRGPGNVRFQPYRLTNSKCYDAADPRISCTACHDPHAEVVRDTAYYDSKCTACHRAKAAGAGAKHLCKVAAASCTSCHMPKVRMPGAHVTFSDHQIRVARAGAPYPN